ncbi:hypothetical protein E4P41_16055 [Geodermatophilus sp. DF01-2]|uniref:hypothetical protein n=1 Tax=Geodermatophilus sp. DF01-2 TaxID=2559610 RepID=UPI0010739284|nr:hypothetical protein [Geodermatophilus sp. DF01_2]TFV56157.1 hypothetical protein E4P41_16055 [Geodermatophilus sp. DF01_2]
MPGRFWTWLAAATLAHLGTQALAFATTWSAAAHGSGTAAAVLTATVLPRVALALPGGAVADRVGAWRVLVAGDAAVLVLVLALVLAAAVVRSGPAPGVLVAAALALGVALAARSRALRRVGLPATLRPATAAPGSPTGGAARPAAAVRASWYPTPACSPRRCGPGEGAGTRMGGRT